MTYVENFRREIEQAEARAGALYLAGALDVVTARDLRDLAELLEQAADRAYATRQLSDREQEQHDEAMAAFASFEEDCTTLAKVLASAPLCFGGEPMSAHQLATLAERYGFDADDSRHRGSFEWMEAIISPLSVESATFEDDYCHHCDRSQASTWHRLILCTGGPHHELRWPKGEPEAARFVSLPWFGRVDMDASDAMVELATWLEDEGEGLGLWTDDEDE